MRGILLNLWHPRIRAQGWLILGVEVTQLVLHSSLEAILLDCKLLDPADQTCQHLLMVVRPLPLRLKAERIAPISAGSVMARLCCNVFW